MTPLKGKEKLHVLEVPEDADDIYKSKTTNALYFSHKEAAEFNLRSIMKELKIDKHMLAKNAGIKMKYFEDIKKKNAMIKNKLQYYQNGKNS